MLIPLLRFWHDKPTGPFSRVNKSSKNEHERLTNLAEFQLNALKHVFQFPNVTHVLQYLLGS